VASPAPRRREKDAQLLREGLLEKEDLKGRTEYFRFRIFANFFYEN
jgi:hypothetical protein